MLPKKALLILTVSLSITACGNAQPVPTATISPTHTPTPVPTNTPTPTLEPWMQSLPADVVETEEVDGVIFGLDAQGKRLVEFDMQSGLWGEIDYMQLLVENLPQYGYSYMGDSSIETDKDGNLFLSNPAMGWDNIELEEETINGLVLAKGVETGEYYFYQDEVGEWHVMPKFMWNGTGAEAGQVLGDEREATNVYGVERTQPVIGEWLGYKQEEDRIIIKLGVGNDLNGETGEIEVYLNPWIHDQSYYVFDNAKCVEALYEGDPQVPEGKSNSCILSGDHYTPSAMLNELADVFDNFPVGGQVVLRISLNDVVGMSNVKIADAISNGGLGIKQLRSGMFPNNRLATNYIARPSLFRMESNSN